MVNFGNSFFDILLDDEGKELSGKRKAYFEHLRQSHNFSFGNPDNLIFTDEFLDMIDEKLNRRVCLYCENTYKDWNALKEHMRKKFHKHLNPHNKEYDKFYVNNYLKQQQTWKLALHEKSLDANQKDAPNDSDEDENWDDWVQAEEEPLKLLCLFCPDHFGSLDRFRAHMLNQHCIEFDAILKYSFYLQVKLVNYVRNCQLMAKCVNCDQKFDDNQKLNEHYLTNAHLQWPSNEQFDRAEYLLPSLQDDHVLRILVDWEQSDESAPVIPESDTYTSNHLIDYDLLKELV